MPTEEEEREYEAGLQKRLLLLREKLAEGKMQFSPGLDVAESLKAVRSRPDGSVDLATVDGLVRSLALGIEAMEERDQAKALVSLADIQSTYFEYIEKNFGEFYSTMKERDLTPHHAGRALSESGESRKAINEGIPGFLSSIREYWESVGPSAQVHVEDMTSLKAVFGGDLFPSHSESIASKAGLYADTIILPDPFLRSEWAFGRWTEEKKVYFFVKHAMNLLQYKSLAEADVGIPIVAVLPDYSALDPDDRQFYLRLGQDDALIHADKLFGRNFTDIGQFMEFASTLDTPEKALTSIVDKSKLLFDSDWGNDPGAQLQRATSGEYGDLLQVNHPGQIIAAQAIGRMSISNELLGKAARFGGTPIIDAPTSWQYFNWKLEYDAGRALAPDGEHAADLHVLRGMQAVAQNEMQWLGRVPHEALIEIRREGSLDELRQILRKGVSELAELKPNNFHRTADQVFDNIQAAFDEHKSKLKDLTSKKWKFAGKDIGTWIAVGTLEVAAAATGMPIYGLSAFAAHQLVDAPKLKNIPKSIKGLAEESRRLNRSPVGMRSPSQGRRTEGSPNPCSACSP